MDKSLRFFSGSIPDSESGYFAIVKIAASLVDPIIGFHFDLLFLSLRKTNETRAC